MTDQANRLRDIVKQKNQVEAPSVIKPKLNARVLTITSGKGGVGKTNFTVNLAIQLRKQGKRVAIIDADFGLANVEVLFGVIPKYSFADVLLGSMSLEDVITKGPLGINFISGGSGLGKLANITETQMSYLLKSFEFLDTIADVVLVDTGAGISRSVINFVKASSETIIITTPEPTAITDAYAIIKTTGENNGYSPEFKVVVNRVDNGDEGLEIFNKLNRVSERFLGTTLKSLGSIPYDHHLVKAVKQQKPVALCFPSTAASKAIDDISHRLFDVEYVERRQEGLSGFMKRLLQIKIG